MEFNEKEDKLARIKAIEEFKSGAKKAKGLGLSNLDSDADLRGVPRDKHLEMKEEQMYQASQLAPDLDDPSKVGALAAKTKIPANIVRQELGEQDQVSPVDTLLSQLKLDRLNAQDANLEKMIRERLSRQK